MPSLELEWSTSNILAGAAVLVSALSWWRARRADRRAGAAILTAEITGHPTVEEAFYGRTSLRITNTGPAVADKITVWVWESPEDAKVRAIVRDFPHRWPLHRTKVTDRLGIDAAIEPVVVGSTENPNHIWIKWRDGAGRQRLHPDPPTEFLVAWV